MRCRSLREMLGRGSSDKKRKRRDWKYNSEGTWWTNLLGRINCSRWLSRKGGWKSKTIKDKLNASGRKDWTLIVLRKRGNKKNIISRLKMQGGKKSKSKEKRRDCSNSTCPICKDLCPRSWPNYQTHLTSNKKPTMGASLKCDSKT